MRTTSAICLCTAALIAATAAPAVAQRASLNSSWEGATHEMQKRGPRSDLRGPTVGGQIIVTPGDNGYRQRAWRSHRPYHGPAYGYAPDYAPGYYR